MKHLLALWVMALMLVFMIGGSAMAMPDPFLDGIMDPTGSIDEGSEEDDHPWGGDQSPGVNPTDPLRPSRIITTTGILPIDLLITDLIYSTFGESLETETVRATSSAALSENRSSRALHDARSAQSSGRKWRIDR